MPITGVLFDKDGTLVDFDRTWGRATHAVMRRLSRADEAVVGRLAALMHYDLAAQRFAPTSPLIGGSPAEVLAAWGEALGRADDPALLAEIDDAFAAETLHALAPIGDPGPILAVLRASGLRLGLATNDAEANARQQLAALGLDVHMDFIAGYDSGYGGKPAPGMVRAFAAHLGVEPASIALVGDTPHDLHAARAAGALAVAVLSGPVGADVLAPLADHVIDAVADLPALLTRLR